jgi:hypothetical protein
MEKYENKSAGSLIESKNRLKSNQDKGLILFTNQAKIGFRVSR